MKKCFYLVLRKLAIVWEVSLLPARHQHLLMYRIGRPWVVCLLLAVSQRNFGLSKSVTIVLCAVSRNSYSLPKRCLVGIPIPRGSVFWELGLLLCVLQSAGRKCFSRMATSAFFQCPLISLRHEIQHTSWWTWICVCAEWSAGCQYIRATLFAFLLLELVVKV